MTSRRRKPSEEHIRDLENLAGSQAAAHALANQQIVEEQQKHLLDEAARNAAGATYRTEGGATPITPGTEPAPGTGESIAGTLTGVGEDVLQGDKAGTPPSKKKRSTRRIILKEKDRRALHLDKEWKDGQGFNPERPLAG